MRRKRESAEGTIGNALSVPTDRINAWESLSPSLDVDEVDALLRFRKELTLCMLSGEVDTQNSVRVNSS